MIFGGSPTKAHQEQEVYIPGTGYHGTCFHFNFEGKLKQQQSVGTPVKQLTDIHTNYMVSMRVRAHAKSTLQRQRLGTETWGLLKCLNI